MASHPHDRIDQEQDASAGDPKRRIQELDDLKQLMDTAHGRRFMWRMLSKAGIYRTSFTGNSTTFFNEGMRNLGLIFMNDLMRSCPDLYHRMVLEHAGNGEESKTDG